MLNFLKKWHRYLSEISFSWYQLLFIIWFMSGISALLDKELVESAICLFFTSMFLTLNFLPLKE